MTATLDRVIEITSRQSGIAIGKLNAFCAIDQDIRISGDDIDELAEALFKEFGGDIAHWPWHRFCDLSEPNLFTFFGFVWAVLTWPFRGRFLEPSHFERLKLGHIAAVLEKGQWFDP